MINSLLRNVIAVSLINSSTPVETQRTAIQLLAAIARFSPIIIVPILGDVMPGILKASSQEDDDQRESSLQVGFLNVFFPPAYSIQGSRSVSSPLPR